jgi:hypothetical protein
MAIAVEIAVPEFAVRGFRFMFQFEVREFTVRRRGPRNSEPGTF